MATLTTALQPGTPPRPILNAFVQPRGLTGRLGGFVMARSRVQQQEVADLVTDPGGVLCELGAGPGLMATLLAERHAQLRLTLVDPSPVMRSQAARRCADLVRLGRVTIVDGTADNLGLAEGGCDTVLSVNSVALWPNPSAALAEIRRVLRPGGQVVLSWHSPTAPSANQRRLALPAQAMEDLTAALASAFDEPRRQDLTHSIAWTARRSI
jgi:ubiquinone/menaquinone biosynthesis C-methylase UbiE